MSATELPSTCSETGDYCPKDPPCEDPCPPTLEVKAGPHVVTVPRGAPWRYFPPTAEQIQQRIDVREWAYGQASGELPGFDVEAVVTRARKIERYLMGSESDPGILVVEDGS